MAKPREYRQPRTIGQIEAIKTEPEMSGSAIAATGPPKAIADFICAGTQSVSIPFSEMP
jgi:hypothetical protein